MEKRVLLAVVLSFVVLYAYQALFPPPEPPARQVPPSVPAAETAAPTAASQPAPSPSTEPSTASPEAAPVVSDTTEREIFFENDDVFAVFSTRGGVLKSWRLKKYRGPTGEPLDLVPQQIPPGTTRPFAISVDDAATTTRLQQALYKPSATEIRIADTPQTLTFDYQDAAGLTASKGFTFTREHPYVIGFSTKVTRDGSPLVTSIEWGPAIGTGIVTKSLGMYSPPPRPIFYRDGDVTRVGASDIQANATQEGAFGFVGVDDHYFLAAALPNGQPLRVQYQPFDVPVPDAADLAAHFVAWSARYPSAPENARFFFGPKDFDVLAAVERDLVRAIDFGIFAWLVVPLLRALKWINGYVGNYGWSIIILTAIINVIIFPLRHKSVVSMRKMQELQPEVKAIQERYSKLKMNDPGRQKMNVELMNLYRERGVNPASGCVPMLLTLPVLFSFYSMLSVAIELRGAPFILWIKDLAVYDPLFISPVVMGLTQLVQTKMTPSTAVDPMQQKMMMIMPIVFTAMFVFAPSGLVLYWTASNLWAIGQQAVTNRLIGPTATRTIRPPAERRLKNVGAGKSAQAKERK